MLKHRPYFKNDLQTICLFPQDEAELFYFYPKAMYPLTPEQLQNVIEQRSDATVVECDGVVVGFANFYRWEGGTCCIGNVVVAPWARGQGVAKYLIQTMISLASDRHAATVVQIACFNQNTSGLLLYTKLGFEPFGIEARQTPNGKRAALIHMRYRVASEGATQPAPAASFAKTAMNLTTSGGAGSMSQHGPRFWEIFFEVYENLPRQGPGNRTCAARALGLCRELPESPAVLDLGCGVGGQTLQLAELTSGSIVAIDSHAPSIDRLQAAIAERRLSQRVTAIVGDMERPEQPFESFDLIWSEGALYSIGLRNALRVCYVLLRPGGYLAFTDAIWRKENPPPAVKAGFDLDYPTMGWLDDDVAAVQECGFEIIGHFALPDEAWWDDFYTPMETRIAELRGKYADSVEDSAILDQLAGEPELHRRHSDYYAYEFFVARRPFRNRNPRCTKR